MNNYDKSKYKIWNWKNPMMLHWILNPGCGIVEFLGMVTPKVMLIERHKTKGLAERTFIPCPHCNTLHHGLTWSTQNALHNKNWFGYYCTNCTKIIPPLRNWLSALLFFIASPFLKNVKSKWLAAQPKRYENLTFNLPTSTDMKYAWLKSGLGYGVAMFVFITLTDWISGETIDLNYILLALFTWVIVAGLFFGIFVMFFVKLLLPKRQIQDKDIFF